MLQYIRNLERQLIQNNMGDLNSLESSDYFELTEVLSADKPVQEEQSLSDMLSGLGIVGNV